MSKYSVQQQPIETLLSWIKSGEIAIPEIQRPFVWNASKVRDLLDSLHKGYPVGYIITWRNPDIRLKDGTLSAGKRVLIDGQQRITALTAAVVGQAVLNKEYKQNKIKIAYNPQAKDHESAFEVCNNAIERNPIWIDDIAPILNGDTPISKIRRQYLEKNPTVDEDKIEEKINELQAIKNRQIGIIELNPDLEIDTVTEIFIRINQKGVVLSNADFVMSKIAADHQFGGNTLRKMIDYFCHLLNDSSFAKHIENNDTQFFQSPDFVKIKWIAQYTDNLYHPNYIDVLRVAYTYAFQRGRFSDLVALLSGRDFEKRSNTEEIAQQSYEKLRTGLMAFFNETHYKRFLLLIRSAGFIHANLLNSQNSLNVAYAIYLHLCDLKMSEHEIQYWVKKWFVMSLLTGRYSGSSESVIERDIKQIQEKGIQEYFQLIELSELNSGFWEHTLVRNLDSSSNINAAYLCYLAAQCQNQEKAFLSGSVKVSDLFETRGDEHHFFPKAYLEKHGYKKSEYNQIANFVYTEQQINIRLQDKPPFEYLQQIQQDIEQGKQQYTSIPSLVEWRENLAVHCIPENWQAFRQENYADFLQERRKLMAKKIQQFYDKF